MRRILLAIAAFAAGPTLAAAPNTAGPFAIAPLEEAGGAGATILIADGPACSAERLAGELAIAEAAGLSTGIVAGSDAGCAAAQRLLDAPRGGGLEIAFTDNAQTFGGESRADAWLSGDTLAAYVWDLDAFQRLGFTPSHRVLGMFGGAEAPDLARMTEAAIAALSRNPAGYVLVLQAGALDAETSAALERARRAGARIVAASGAAEIR